MIMMMIRMIRIMFSRSRSMMMIIMMREEEEEEDNNNDDDIKFCGP